MEAFIAFTMNSYKLKGDGMDMGTSSSGRSIFPKDSAKQPTTTPTLGPSAAKMLNEIDRAQPGLPGPTKQGKALLPITVKKPMAATISRRLEEVKERPFDHE
jgi:hypothetical protein